MKYRGEFRCLGMVGIPCFTSDSRRDTFVSLYYSSLIPAEDTNVFSVIRSLLCVSILRRHFTTNVFNNRHVFLTSNESLMCASD
jgi:hypothetical protein